MGNELLLLLGETVSSSITIEYNGKDAIRQNVGSVKGQQQRAQLTYSGSVSSREKYGTISNARGGQKTVQFSRQ